MRFDFEELGHCWPSALVARREISSFSGGLLRPHTMANLDSLGQGPPRIRVGRSIAYPKNELVKWLRARATEEAAHRDREV